MITIEILVPAYLKQFLITNYGEAYRAGHDDELGTLVISALRKKTNHSNLTMSKQRDLVPYDIKISMSYFEKSGCHIFEKDRIMIARAIDRSFRNSLFRAAILNYEQFGIPYKETISKYLLSFGIDEDVLSYSTIRKDFNRKKNIIHSRMHFEGQK